MWGDAMKAVEQYLPDDTFQSPNPRTIEGQTVTVPSLYGLSTDAAAATLRKAGFTPVVGPTVDSGYPQGTVAYLSPGSGSLTPTGSTVTIYVSDGTPYVPPAPEPKKKQRRRGQEEAAAAAAVAAAAEPAAAGTRSPAAAATVEAAATAAELSRAGVAPRRPRPHRRPDP